MLVVYRRYFVPYLLWAALIAAPFLFYNYKTFGAILQPYYLPSASNAAWNSFASGLAGTVVSPDRGLFTFSPILLFSFLGLYLKLRRHEINSLDITLLSIITLHWLMLGSWLIWWGGHAYGPRLFTDMLPFLIYFMIPAIEVIRIPQHPAEAIYLGLFTGALFVSVLIDAPVYLRLGALSRLEGYDTPFEIGRSVTLRPGSDVTLIATGGRVAAALEAHANLARRGVSARVVNMHTLKPLDREAVVRAAEETGRVVTVEEHSILGGLGGAVAEVMAERGVGRLQRVGVRDVFCTEIAPYPELLRIHGLDASGIEAAVEKVLA